jgi:hypothetical protein
MDTEWRREALCLKRNNVFWFPPVEAEAPEHYYAVAREVCKHCPVWKLCLEDGQNERWGMWGGLTPKDRQGVKDNKQSLLKAHGSWVRYRQGCGCELCTNDHNEQMENVKLNMSCIPYMNEPVEDISTVRYGLLY